LHITFFSLPSVAVTVPNFRDVCIGSFAQSTTASRGRRTTHCIVTREACSNTVVAFLLCVLCSTQRALGSLLQQRIYGEVVSCDSEAEISINYVPDEENPNLSGKTVAENRVVNLLIMCYVTAMRLWSALFPSPLLRDLDTFMMV
jgi:hypothetical protein